MLLPSSSPQKYACNSCIPSYMHCLWMLEKKGGQWKDRSGWSYGRRRSSCPFLITGQHLWLQQQPPSLRRRPTYTNCMSPTLSVWRRRKLRSYVDDWNHERKGSVTDLLYSKDGREGKIEIEERTMSPKLALKLSKTWGKRSIFPWLVAASWFQSKEGMKTPK